MPAKPRLLTALIARLAVFLGLFVLGAANALAAEGESHEGGHEALPLFAEEVVKIGPLSVTNSMIMVWIVAAVLIFFAQAASRNMRLIPGPLQNFVEWLVESLLDFFAGIMGERLAKRTFWFIGTVFILILASNWAGLIPGVGTIGFELEGTGVDAHDKFRPFFRGANADLNLTMAMALTFFVLWFYWSLTEIGPKNFIKHIFAPKGDYKGVVLVLMGALFLAVGVIEVISIAVRPLALMLRLFGNVYAGENMLESLMAMVPNWLKWAPVLPFYFLELLVGFVQALVFAVLCAVFTKLMCEHEDEHEGEHPEEPAAETTPTTS